MNIFQKAIGHFCTITKHRHQVIIHCYKAGILFQGLRHDLSKYTPTEFIPGVKYYTGKRSPNEGERKENGYSLAWLHHKGRNRHHFEYWTDYNTETKRVEPVEMPYRFVVEMFCDRVAASKVYNGSSYKKEDSFNYFEQGKARRIIHEKTSNEIEMLLMMLAEKGEQETFQYIKQRIREMKNNK